MKEHSTEQALVGACAHRQY